jgi:phage tail protein X
LVLDAARRRLPVKQSVLAFAVIILVIGGAFLFVGPPTASAAPGSILSIVNGSQGTTIVVKDTSLNPSNTYTVCFSQGYYYCNIGASVPNVQYTFTGSALSTGQKIIVPEIIGGQYFVVILSGTTQIATDSFTITPSVPTFPTTANDGSSQTLKVNNLVSTASYTVCFETNPTTGCSTGTSETGSALGTGASVKVPDLASGIYYVNVESATSPPSSLQIVSSSTVLVESTLTLGANSGIEGASVSAKDTSLNPSTTYTICFSQGYYYCSMSSSIPNVQYSFTGTLLSTGQTLTVPRLYGGEYFVVIEAPSSVFVTSSAFYLTPAVITFPNSGAALSSQTIKVTNLVNSAAATYTICFETSAFTGCSTGTSKTGAALTTGVSITVPSMSAGAYYVNVESATSASSQQIVASSDFVVTGASTPVEALNTHSGGEGTSLTVSVTNLVSGDTYTVCFSQGYYYCSMSSSIPNVQYSLTGAQLSTPQTLTVPELLGGPYFVVTLLGSTFEASGAYTTTLSLPTFPLTAGVGSSQTVKATNLVSVNSYTVCFETSPTTGCSSGVSGTGAAFGLGVKLTVPDITPGQYYVNLESAVSPSSSLQIVTTATVLVTSSATVSISSGNEGASVTLKDLSLASGGSYTVCFSQGYYYCSTSASVPNNQYTFTGSSLTTGGALTVPDLVGGQYFVVILSGSTMISDATFEINPSVQTFAGSATVGSAQTIKSTSLVSTTSYIICFETSPASGCSSGISETGTTLNGGVSITVPDISPGLYYTNIESSPGYPASSLQIVSTSSVLVTSVETLTTHSGIVDATTSVKDTGLHSSNSYTVCFSQDYYTCGVSASVPNVQYSLTGAQLSAGYTLTIPQIIGGQYYVVLLAGSTLVSTSPYFITGSVITFATSPGVGSPQTIKVNNLASTTTYTICFETEPTSGCSSGTAETGSALNTGVSIVVPDLTPGQYYLNIESATSPVSSFQIVTSAPVLVTSTATLTTTTTTTTTSSSSA